MAEKQCIQARWRCEDAPSPKMGEKKDLSDLKSNEHGCWFQKGWVLHTADLLGFHHISTISRVYREWPQHVKISSQSGCVEENSFFFRFSNADVKGQSSEWADWLQTIESQ